MASGLIAVLRNPGLHKKIFFTLTMITLYRIGSQIPTPGIGYQLVNVQLKQILEDQSSVYSLINLFSGGALLQMAIFGIGIVPCITASIIARLLMVVIPHFEQLKEEGQSGQTRMTQYTRYLIIALALPQSAGIVTTVNRGALLSGSQPLLAKDAGVLDLVVMVIMMTAGVVLVMWIGELITDRGVGNGVSLLILVGIAAGIPVQGADILRSTIGVVFATVIVTMLIFIIGVIFIKQGQRRILVQYAKRMAGHRQYDGSSTYLPLKVNQADVISVIFASSLIYMPILTIQIAQSGQSNPNMDNWWQRNVIQYLLVSSSWQYILLFFPMIIFFPFFYTSVQYDPHEQAENMKKYGGFVPGFRPECPTAKYLSCVLIRLLIVGSLYLVLIAVLPNITPDVGLGDANVGTGSMFGDIALLTLVSVALTTVKRVESQMMQCNHEGFSK